jgi:hypothetical protein
MAYSVTFASPWLARPFASSSDQIAAMFGLQAQNFIYQKQFIMPFIMAMEEVYIII